eukprot:m.56536 g.56536  ORF g.56536 m.56536 type:complete len:117 (+) comp13020_c0_seq1:130-480(+)
MPFIQFRFTPSGLVLLYASLVNIDLTASRRGPEGGDPRENTKHHSHQSTMHIKQPKGKQTDNTTQDKTGQHKTTQYNITTTENQISVADARHLRCCLLFTLYNWWCSFLPPSILSY